ncbi:MAG: FMN-binding protein [Motilibacteraceae bacterium]
MPSLLGRPSLARAAVVTAGTAVGLVALLSAKASTTPAPERVALGSRVPPGGQAAAGPAPSAPAPGPSSAPTTRATGGAHPSTSPSAHAGPATTAGSARRTVTGPVVQTDYGPVQVKVVAQGHKILDVVAVQTPNGDRHSEEVAAYAVPILHHEALAAQSANIDAVSGATYTSIGYAQSLQAALDALSR